MKTRLLIPVLLFALLVPFTGHSASEADTYTVISGTVRDARTNRTLPFATMYIPGTYLGTVANSNGYFTFKIRNDVNADRFLISYMGYEVTSYSIREYAGKESEFLLKPHTVSLQEVTFRPMNPRDIVMKALDRIGENYPQQPYQLTGFYRETIRQRRDYLTVAEAVVDIYKESYNQSRSDDLVRIVRGRKSGNVKKADTLLVKLQGGPQVALLLDIVKNNELVISKQNIDHYNYELSDLVIIDDKPQYVIKFKPRVILPFALFEGKLYICNQTLAVTMTEFGYDLSDQEKVSREFVRKKPATLNFSTNNTRYLVKYQEINGKYYINYLRSDLEFSVNWRRKLFRTRYNLMFELAIMDRSSQNTEQFARRESFRNYNILADMVPVYFTDDFWGEYNYIEPDVNIEEAIQKLNRNLRNGNRNKDQ